MTQNMFQEGLYHVFLKETAHRSTRVTSAGELINDRIHRWFGTVVNTRLLVAGVRCLCLLLVHLLLFYSFYSTCLLHTSCFPTGGADPQCHCLHINHTHPCMCELQLLCYHDNACVVKPICESTSALADTKQVRV